MWFRLYLSTYLILVAYLCGTLAQAQELIKSFHSEIEVNQDRSIVVTEYITVQSEGYRIRRGIFRDIPYRYYSEDLSEAEEKKVEIIEVSHNGKRATWRLGNLEYGTIRVFIGDRLKNLRAGEHKYMIKYRVEDIIKQSLSSHTLYWNVTGHFWEFEIERTSVTINFPNSVKPELIFDFKVFAGYRGSTENVDGEISNNEILSFVNQSPLKSKQGVTILANYSPELASGPSRAKDKNYFGLEFRQVIVLFIGMCFFLAAFLMWFLIGVDYSALSIIPRYEAPPYSPGLVYCFIRRRVEGAGFKPLSLDLISLAQKGFMRIVREAGELTVKRTEKPIQKGTLTTCESMLYARLFKNSKVFTFSESNRDRIRDIQSQHNGTIEDLLENMIIPNRFWSFLLYFLALVAVYFIAQETVFSTVTVFFLFICGLCTWDHCF